MNAWLFLQLEDLERDKAKQIADDLIRPIDQNTLFHNPIEVGICE